MSIKRCLTVLLAAALVALAFGAAGFAETKSRSLTGEVAPQKAVEQEDARRSVELRLKMMENIKTREKELARKEDELRVKEERLKALQREFAATIEKLIALEKKVSQEEEAKLRKLAKVFESAPPEEGGKLLSALDANTAAGVISRMNSRKAGKLWAFVQPKMAKKISRILTKKKR